MLKSILILMGLIFTYLPVVHAQKIPSTIPFQAIAKDYVGTPANERKIYIQTNLIAGSITGKTIFTEVHETTTDVNGVFSIMIGAGKKSTGSLSSLNELDWEEGPYFLGIQLAIQPYAPVQGWQYENNWINMGTTSLGIVPYAFYATQTSGLQSKLNASDTAQMLRNYVKNTVIKLLDSAIGSKVSFKDTLAMLAPYTKATATDTVIKNVTTNYSVYLDYDSLKNKPVLFNKDYDALINKPVLFNKEYDSLLNKPILFDGNYSSLTNRPILFSKEYDSLLNKPVLFSKEYDSLLHKPVLFDGNYTSLNNRPILFSKEYDSLLNKPILFDGNYLSLNNRPLLFSKEYDSLLNKPVLFDGNYTSLTNRPILFSKEYDSLLNKPILFSKEYDSLLHKPVLFDGNYLSLNNRPLLFNGDYNSLTNQPTLSLTGDITNVGEATTLSISGVASGTYGSSLSIPTITVDAKGRITAAINTPITPNNFPNKTNVEKNALPISTATGTVIWCSDCGTKGQLQVFNGTEWTDLTGGTALTTGIVLSTLNLTEISSTSATAATSISNDGGATITAKGVVWSTSVNPTIALTTKTNNGTGTSAYTASITTLVASTLYYVRAYATNANGTVYGTQQSFTTLGAVPTLTTTTVSGISINTANTGGNITADGGTTITSRGLCWSTSSNPTINDNKLINGNGFGSFTINLTGLQGGTTYYIRAYATNAAGTGYGNQISFNTSTLAIGVSYLGGKVAYIFQSGDVGYVAGQTHGFIIMSHNMGMQVKYSNNGAYSNTSMNFGTGKNNTSILYNLTTTGLNAAKYVYNVLYDGYDDWYIPSYYEWNKIAPNWSQLGLGDGIYHSSSERDSGYYFTMGFFGGGTSYQSRQEVKTDIAGVIGIRKF